MHTTEMDSVGIYMIKSAQARIAKDDGVLFVVVVFFLYQYLCQIYHWFLFSVWSNASISKTDLSLTCIFLSLIWFCWC